MAYTPSVTASPETIKKCIGCGKEIMPQYGAPEICRACVKKMVREFDKHPKKFKTISGYHHKFRCPICGKHLDACQCKKSKVARKIAE